MSETRRPPSKRPCPICKSPRQTEEYAPFCSARCRDKDLNRWFNDGYSVPGRPADPEEIAREQD
ncbi:DNA gyrase inhibitor YacG [Citromicrobium bathyomarinum]|uniref:DNA gyrase inhibitor YacG n=1 Tax=Citromicrobium bathyomarinum TaxID=72174 RepID=UPI00315A6617